MNSLFTVIVTEALSLYSYHLRGWNTRNTLCYVKRAGLREFDSRQRKYYSFHSNAAPQPGLVKALIKWITKGRLEQLESEDDDLHLSSSGVEAALNFAFTPLYAF
jgi:hypothetical protein